jgi:hypothetical protein
MRLLHDTTQRATYESDGMDVECLFVLFFFVSVVYGF